MEMQVLIDRFFKLFDSAWQKLPGFAVTLLLGILVIKIIKLILHSVIRVTRANQAMKGIIISVVDFGLWVLLLAALLQQVGLTQLSLALSGSVVIAGLAISTGSAAFIQDLVSGIFLAQDNDFNVGYRVEVEGINGVVEKMDARKVRVRDDHGDLHIFPNATFDRAAWIVKGKKH